MLPVTLFFIMFWNIIFSENTVYRLKENAQAGVVVHTYSPSAQRLRQEDH